MEVVLPRLETEEGFRANSYKDSTGNTTIGYGFNVDAGISRRAAAALLQAQIEELQGLLLKYRWYAGLDAVRQSVILDLAFNDGLSGLLHFVDMISAIGRGNWVTAKTELLNSKGAQENPHRYQLLAQILFTGSIP